MTSKIVIIFSAILAYSTMWGGQFVFDDHFQIAPKKDQSVGQMIDVVGEGRALPAATLWVNKQISESSWHFHAANLLIHIACAMLLASIVTTLIGGHKGKMIGAAAAVLWCVHPLATESVTYIVQGRYEGLCWLMSLVAAYCVCRRTTGWLVIGVLACVAGAMSKQWFAIVPVVLVLMDRVYFCCDMEELWRKRRHFHLASLMVSGWLVWRNWHWLGGEQLTSENWGMNSEAMSPFTYLMYQGSAITEYLGLFFFPAGQSIHHGMATSPWQAWPVALVASLLVLTAWAFYRWPRAVFPLVAFWLLLAPTSSVVPINQVMAEHRMYAPMAMLMLFVVGVGYMAYASVLPDSFDRTPVAVALVVALVSMLSVATMSRNLLYHDEVDLWADASSKNQSLWIAVQNHAASLQSSGRHKEAIKRFSDALLIRPRTPNSEMGMALSLFRIGQKNQGHEWSRRAIRKKLVSGRVVSDPAAHEQEVALLRQGVWK